MSNRARGICLRVSSIFVLLIIWWVAAILMDDVEVLPGPVLIFTTIWSNLIGVGPEGKSPYFHMGVTLARTFIAFGAAMLAGIGIGLTMGLRKTFEHSLMALIPLLLTMPTILMVFLAVLWFGFTEVGSLVAVVGVVTPFVSVNMFEGLISRVPLPTKYLHGPVGCFADKSVCPIVCHGNLIGNCHMILLIQIPCSFVDEISHHFCFGM